VHGDFGLYCVIWLICVMCIFLLVIDLVNVGGCVGVCSFFFFLEATLHPHGTHDCALVSTIAISCACEV
jgi:hypothetical protein